MSALEVKSSSAVCRKCGTAYGQLKNYFPVSYSYLYKGTGYLPYCKKCVEEMYMEYLDICREPADAVRQMCRKLDLYWNEKSFNACVDKSTSRNMMSTYLAKINHISHAGKSYDDTLKEEGVLWVWPTSKEVRQQRNVMGQKVEVNAELPSEEVISFWGPGYTPEMYAELEQRLQYYKSQMEDVDESQRDMSTDALLRQIAMLEIDINKARADGRAVDKMMSTLSSLLSSLSKPTKKKDDISSSAVNTPFGVWIKRWEDERPVPEIDEDLKDVDHIVKYIQVWFFGHLCKMLGIKNSYSKLYEEEIARLRVDRPEYDDEDDDTLLYDIFGDGGIVGDDYVEERSENT